MPLAILTIGDDEQSLREVPSLAHLVAAENSACGLRISESRCCCTHVGTG